MNDPRAFYDGLAEFYHLIFEDWDRSMARQGDALASVIERWPSPRKVLLDASCGIGTQAIALSLKGFTVVGSDISMGGLRRGRREARSRGVGMESVAADFRALPFRSGCADVVLACDNAIPHLLSLGEIEKAISELKRCARPGGGVIISMRDYTRMPPGTIEERPYGEREWKGRRYAAEQEWAWKGSTYDLTMRFRPLDEGEDDRIEFKTTYFAVGIEEVLRVMSDAGLVDVERIDREFYQPLLIGSAPVGAQRGVEAVGARLGREAHAAVVTGFPRSPSPARWGVALSLAAVFLVLVALPFVLLPVGWYWLPLPLIYVFGLPPLESLLLTPLYTVSGRFHYYSPFLLRTRSGDTYDLHVGMLYDYVRGLRWSDRGARARRIVVVEMLRGLLALCDEIEAGAVAGEAPISATSYFFSDRSVARLGFTVEPAESQQILNLITASLTVALRLSFTQGRLRWPDLRQVRRVTTTAAALLQHRPEIRRLLARIERAAP